jgi:CDP-diacylglycerol--serine O-phosphatidyltransferase
VFTALNIFCGFLAVVQIVNANYVNAAWLIFLATVFDALDGRIARATGQSNEFGLQMDSLGDVISAGLAPALLVHQIYLYRLHPPVGLILAFFPLLFAAFRLARYNVYTMQQGKSSDYLGLPAPSAAVTIAGFVILHNELQWEPMLSALVGIVPLISLLMASTIRYDGIPNFNLKEKGSNRVKLIVTLVGILAFLITPRYVLFPFMALYIIFGIVKAVVSILRQEPDADITIIAEERRDSYPTP